MNKLCSLEIFGIKKSWLIDLALDSVLQLTYAKYTNKNMPYTRMNFSQIHESAYILYV